LSSSIALSGRCPRGQRAAELAVINAVHTALADQLSIQGVYDAVGDKLVELYRGSNVGIRLLNPDTGVLEMRYLFSDGRRASSEPRAVLGFEEAIARANLALAAGADVVFVEAPQTLEEVAAVPSRVKGPCLLNIVYGGRTPDLPLAEAERLGYAIAILPGLLLGAVIDACDEALEGVKAQGRYPKPRTETSPARTFARFGAAEWDARRTAFRDAPAVAPAAVSAPADSAAVVAK
jgi:hypothetical protein